MISKQRFCELLRQFREIENDTAAAHNALKKLDPDFGGLSLSRHANLIGRLLEELVDDTGQDSMVSYFIYERNWGEKDMGPVTIQGRNFKLKTPEHLYEIIMACHKNNEKNNADT